MPRRTAIPRQFSTPAQAKARNWVVLGMFAFAALAGPVALMTASKASTTAASAAARVANDPGEPRYRPFAEVVAAQWAHGESAVPAAAGVTLGRPKLTRESAEALSDKLGLDIDLAAASRGGATVDVLHLAWSAFDQVHGADGTYSELHHFVVATRQGVFKLAVPVTRDSREWIADRGVHSDRPVLGGTPALTPYLSNPAEGSTVKAIGWSGMTPDRPSDATTKRATEWAAAFAADDNERLAELALENDPALSYRGLGGFRVADVAVPAAAMRSDGHQVVRVNMAVVNHQAVYLNLEYDLLVANPGTAEAAIVAWGPRGSGAILVATEPATIPGAANLSGFADPGTADATPRDATPDATLRAWLRIVGDAQSTYNDARFGYATQQEATLEALLGQDFAALSRQPYFTVRWHLTPDRSGYCVSMTVRDVARHINSDTDAVADGPCDAKWPPDTKDDR